MKAVAGQKGNFSDNAGIVRFDMVVVFLHSENGGEAVPSGLPPLRPS
jgi:hypothetical protein